MTFALARELQLRELNYANAHACWRSRAHMRRVHQAAGDFTITNKAKKRVGDVYAVSELEVS